jgi:hypothetical protein
VEGRKLRLHVGQGSHATGFGVIQWFVLPLIYALTLLLTSPVSQGDTVDYADAVVQHLRNEYQGPVDPVWESGHLLWRPLGLGAYHLLHLLGATEPDRLVVARGLIAVSVLAGLGCLLVLNAWLFELTSSQAIALAVTCAVLYSNAYLNYVQTGSSYVTGLFFLLLGHWLLWRGMGECEVRLAWLAGLFLGLAALIWLPYILAFASAVMFPMVWRHGREGLGLRDRLRQSLNIASSSVLVLAIGYGAALWMAGAHSSGGAAAWVHNVGHGWAQNRRGLRFVFGLPRSFIDMQDQGLLLKRYLFHDPYAPTSLVNVSKGLVLVGVFYAAMAAILLPLLGTDGGRKLLALLAIVAAPVVGFAVFLFEPGSPERYMPAYPVLAAAVAWSLTTTQGSRLARFAGAILLAIMVVVNLQALSRSRAVRLQAAQAERVSGIRERVRQEGMVGILTNRDELMAFAKTYPFHQMNRPEALPIYEVLEIGNQRLVVWREDFAKRALDCWSRGGEVWVSRRFLADRPDPRWLWVEGDDPHVKWPQVPEFFGALDYQEASGGADGFVLLKESAANRATLQAAQAGRKGTP